MTAPRIRFLSALATTLGLVASGFDAHLAPQRDGWWHGLTGAPSFLHVTLALATGVAVWFLGRWANSRPYLLMSVGLLPLIPAMFGVGSGLLFFSNYTLLLLLAAIVGSTTTPYIPKLSVLGTRSVFLISFVFFIFVGRFIPGAAGPQGDEPHYLLIADSLIHDGDVDLKNQFDEKAFSKFTSAALEPHTAPRSPKGALYAIHTPGLAALIAPGYALAGYAGARVVLCALMAGVVSLLFFTARTVFGPPVAGFIFLLSTFASPLAVYANAVFPDSAATLPLAATLACLAAMSASRLALACISIAGLPWLHPRFLPLAVVLALGLSIRGGISLRRGAAAFIPLVASTALLLVHFQSVFGSFSLSAAYGPSFSSDVSVFRIPWGASALLMDRQFGLLLFTPALLLATAGASELWRRDRLLAASAIASSGVLLGVGGSFSMWWGGASAPGRFLIGAAPALLLLCAALWPGGEARGHRRALVGAAAGFGGGILWLACLAPRALHNRSDGESGLLRLLAPALDIDRFFPSFVIDAGVWLAVAWALILLLLLLRPRVGLGFAVLSIAFVNWNAQGPLLDPFASSLKALESWDDHRITFGGSDISSAFVLDVPLGSPSWELSSTSKLYSPRFSLPKGPWTIRVESETIGTPDALNLARIRLISDNEGDAPLCSVLIQAGERTSTATCTVSQDERRLRLRGEGLQSKATVLSVRLEPGSLRP